MNSDKPRTFLQKVGDVFVTIAAIILKIFLVALVIICCPVLFVLAVVIVALVFAVIAALVGGGALLYEMLPAIDWTPIATISPVMTLLGTISGIALIAIPLGAFLYTIMRQLFHWSPMGDRLEMVSVYPMGIGTGHRDYQFVSSRMAAAVVWTALLLM